MEIVIAIGLIAVISLLVIGTLARLLSGGGKSAHQTAAGLLAQQVLDSAIAAGPPRWGFASLSRTDWKGSASLRLPGEDSLTEFLYRVEVLRLRQSPQDLGTVSQVSATVWWWGEQPGGRTEQGQTSVRASRTVYVRGESAAP
jgi:hypothetical protein